MKTKKTHQIKSFSRYQRTRYQNYMKANLSRTQLNTKSLNITKSMLEKLHKILLSSANLWEEPQTRTSTLALAKDPTKKISISKALDLKPTRSKQIKNHYKKAGTIWVSMDPRKDLSLCTTLLATLECSESLETLLSLSKLMGKINKKSFSSTIISFRKAFLLFSIKYTAILTFLWCVWLRTKASQF